MQYTLFAIPALLAYLYRNHQQSLERRFLFGVLAFVLAGVVLHVGYLRGLREERRETYSLAARYYSSLEGVRIGNAVRVGRSVGRLHEIPCL